MILTFLMYLFVFFPFWSFLFFSTNRHCVVALITLVINIEGSVKMETATVHLLEIKGKYSWDIFEIMWCFSFMIVLMRSTRVEIMFTALYLSLVYMVEKVENLLRMRNTTNKQATATWETIVKRCLWMYIVQVSIFLRRDVGVDVDWRLDHLCGSHFQCPSPSTPTYSGLY